MVIVSSWNKSWKLFCLGRQTDIKQWNGVIMKITSSRELTIPVGKIAEAESIHKCREGINWWLAQHGKPICKKYPQSIHCQEHWKRILEQFFTGTYWEIIGSRVWVPKLFGQRNNKSVWAEVHFAMNQPTPIFHLHDPSNPIYFSAWFQTSFSSPLFHFEASACRGAYHLWYAAPHTMEECPYYPCPLSDPWVSLSRLLGVHWAGGGQGVHNTWHRPCYLAPC